MQKSAGNAEFTLSCMNILVVELLSHTQYVAYHIDHKIYGDVIVICSCATCDFFLSFIINLL